MKKKFKKLEKRVDAIVMEVVTLKNKGNDPLVNIDLNKLSFEEAHKKAYESICRHYGIIDTELKGATFNKQKKEGSVEIRYPKGWYKSTEEGNLFLAYWDGDKYIYGFIFTGEWKAEVFMIPEEVSYRNLNNGIIIKATDEEVFHRLTKEAERLGFENNFSFYPDFNHLLSKGKLILENGKWGEVIETKPSFKPVFMKCTQEQFDRMRPKLESVGCVFGQILWFKGFDYLTNNYNHKNKIVTNINLEKTHLYNQSQVHTEAEFLEACGYVEETIEYTLENIQVDCRGLTREHIKAMAVVFENTGYKPFHNEEKTNLEVKSIYLFLKIHNDEFTVGQKNEDKTTITYEKFMELFSEKPIEEEQKTVRISDLPVRNIEELHAEHKEAKREPKVGDVVKAWDDDKSKFVYGVLISKYESIVSGTYYSNFELVTEININDFKK